MSEPHEKIYVKIARALAHEPVSEVIPVLITASARCLVDCSEFDNEKLEKAYVRFCNLVQDTMADMIKSDEAEARKATKQ